MNKRGFYPQIAVIVIIGLVFAMLMIGFFAWSLAGPIITKTSSDINGIVQGAVTQTGDSALINASQSSFQPANDSIQILEWLSFFMIIMLFLTLIIMAFYVRTYPFLAFIWVFIIIILVFLSIFITVVYQDFTSKAGYLSDAYKSWESSHYFLLYLPGVITAIGIVGGIIMFLLATKDKEGEALPL